MPSVADRPTWSLLSECPRCIVHRPNLVRTTVTAVVVGTVLFAINHLGPVLAGRADVAAWIGTGASYVVPFCVANVGVLVASRRSAPWRPSTGTSIRGNAAPTWQRMSECLRCVTYRPHLLRTLTTALIIGTVYFVVNQLDVVARGNATTQVWVATGITYLVPFSVSNVGVLVACRRRDPSCAGTGDDG